MTLKDNFITKSELVYYYELNKMIQKIDNLDSDNISEYLKTNTKNRKQVSNIKNGIRLLIRKGIIQDEGFTNTIEKIQYVKPKHRRESEQQFKLRNIQNAINRMKNKRLKIGYRLMIISGLRVEETSRLIRDDIEVDNDKLIITVKNGKGNKKRIVECLPDKWLLEELIKLEDRKDKLFYSDGYMKNMANKLNFHCHDLRKTFSNIIYYNTIDNATEILQDKLGHVKDTRTYLKYISRDINLYNTKWENIAPLESEVLNERYSWL
jgi:integrase